MSAIPYSDDVLAPDVVLVQLTDVAKQLDRAVSRVQQMLRDHQLIAVKREGVLSVPEQFFGDDGHVLEPLPGLISVLRDGGYRETEIVRWLFTIDDSLPGMPIDALHGHRAREVVRRAQAMGF
ncbi:MAG TPA: Rv2175c family DNA-binding protein [Aldersonia sp.]